MEVSNTKTEVRFGIPRLLLSEVFIVLQVLPNPGLVQLAHVGYTGDEELRFAVSAFPI
jgi:hypothetical protein